MSDMEIRCSACGCVVTHNCFRGAVDQLKKLYSFTLEGEDVPFFSEDFLYKKLGKDNARTVLAQLSHVLRSLGVDPDMTFMKSGCRHRMTQFLVYNNEETRTGGLEWCESCGAVRRDEGKWEVPTSKQKVPKLKKKPRKKSNDKNLDALVEARAELRRLRAQLRNMCDPRSSEGRPSRSWRNMIEALLDNREPTMS